MRILEALENRFVATITATQKIEADEQEFVGDTDNCQLEWQIDDDASGRDMWDMTIEEANEYADLAPDESGDNAHIDDIIITDADIDEETGDNGSLTIQFTVSADRKLDDQDFKFFAEALLEYAASRLNISASGYCGFVDDDFDPRTNYGHVQHSYSDSVEINCGATIVDYNNPVQYHVDTRSY